MSLSFRCLRGLLVAIAAVLSILANAEIEFEGKTYDYTLAVYVNSSKRFNLFRIAEDAGVLIYRVDYHSSFDPTSNTFNDVKIYRDGSWVSRDTMPPPDAWYDFSFNVSILDKADKIRATKLRKALFASTIPALNPAEVKIAASKLRFAKHAARFSLKHPITQVATEANVKEMEKRFPLLFFKARNGNQGDGVLKVERKGKVWSIEGHYLSEKNWMTLDKTTSTRQNLFATLEMTKLVMNKFEPYIIQQGIDVFQMDGKPTYFRVYMQRGDAGILQEPIVVARIGGKTAHGGIVSEPQPVIEALAAQTRVVPSLVLNRIQYVGQQAFNMIEGNMKTTLAELTMDVVVDAQGEAYVLEANIKPGQLYFKVKEDIGDASRFGGDTNYHDRALAIECERDRRLLNFGRFIASKSH